MAETPSTMLELGTDAPTFDLKNMNTHTGAPWVSLSDYHDQSIVVAFICNHCPYVVKTIDRFAQLAVEWQEKGAQVIAISSNDIVHYPADAPEKMTEFAREHKFEFPYLYDESQLIARSYLAACTPDYYLFNSQHKLIYRGQFDDARPGNNKPVTGENLNAAVAQMLTGLPISEMQIPSVGCSIKWKKE